MCCFFTHILHSTHNTCLQVKTHLLGSEGGQDAEDVYIQCTYWGITLVDLIPHPNKKPWVVKSMGLATCVVRTCSIVYQFRTSQHLNFQHSLAQVSLNNSMLPLEHKPFRVLTGLPSNSQVLVNAPKHGPSMNLRASHCLRIFDSAKPSALYDEICSLCVWSRNDHGGMV